MTTARTVHDFVKSFALGEARTVPSNCSGTELKSYAESRFGYFMAVSDDGQTIKRICPKCHR